MKSHVYVEVTIPGGCYNGSYIEAEWLTSCFGRDTVWCAVHSSSLCSGMSSAGTFLLQSGQAWVGYVGKNATTTTIITTTKEHWRVYDSQSKG